jgi:hypothetical protein
MPQTGRQTNLLSVCLTGRIASRSNKPDKVASADLQHETATTGQIDHVVFILHDTVKTNATTFD